MASDIINIPLSGDIVKRTCAHIMRISGGEDFSRIAVVMPSKRPSLFIKRELSREIKKSFVPPDFFTFDELVDGINAGYFKYEKISEIDAAYVIYDIVKKNIPQLLGEQRSFYGFFAWSYEILSFMDILEIEKISDDKLLNVKMNADIGFDLPDNINNLLKHMYFIRREFRRRLEILKKTTRSLSYAGANLYMEKYFEKYDRVILFNPYYLNKSETDMFKKLYDFGNLDVIIKGDAAKWPSLSKLCRNFTSGGGEKIDDKLNNDINFYCAYDGESQACLAKNLISGMAGADMEQTVVIVPDNSILPSVMNHIYGITRDVNVSVGYPAKKTTVFALMSVLIAAQKTKKNEKYYVKDLLSVLSNPLVKNMRFIGNPDVTRIIIHKLTDHFDRFNGEAEFAGYDFISLDEIKNNKKLQNDVSETVSLYWQTVKPERVKELLDEMFALFFYGFEKISDMRGLGVYLRNVADNIVRKSLIGKYSFNLGAVNILYDISGKFEKSICKDEKFEQYEMLYILEEILLRGNIPLAGSPLKGIQILGMLEARGLSFKNVFVLSMQDSVVPKIKETNPLIPKDIMNFLNAGYAGRETEIQKYHLMSIISPAERVSLIYQDDDKNERSRFIEEIVWNKQLEEKSLEVANTVKAVLPAKPLLKNKQEFKKTPGIKAFLKRFSYSPTSIDSYLKCKLHFYYKYVLKLSEKTDFERDYQSRDTGDLIHKFLEETFRKGLLKSDLSKDGVFDAYKEILHKKLEKEFKKRETGGIFLLKKLIEKRMSDFYENEMSRNFKRILQSEYRQTAVIDIGRQAYNFKVKIDRIDENDDGSIWIIDYKTGSVKNPLSSKINDLTQSGREFAQKNIRSFQLPVYKYVYENCGDGNAKVENCVLYSLRDGEKKYLFKEKTDPGGKNDVYDVCIGHLKALISEINGDEPFRAEKYDNPDCMSCPYFYMCR